MADDDTALQSVIKNNAQTHLKKINFMVPTYAVYANKHAAQANTAY